VKRIAAVVITLLPAAAVAQEPAAGLADYLRAARAASPALRAAEARLRAARTVPDQAGALPDPEASIGYTNEGTSGLTLGEREDARLSLGWRQEVPYPGKRRTAGESASFEAEAVEHDLDRLRLEVDAEVKTAFADLYRLDRTAAVLHETRTLLTSFAQSASRRYEAGEGIQENILKAQTEIVRLDTEIERVAQERLAAALRLEAAIGRPAGGPIGPAVALPPAELPHDLEAIAGAAAEEAPEVAALAAVARSAEAEVRLARLGLKPDFVWSAAYDHRGGLDPMIGAMFGVRLPLYRRHKQVQALQQAEWELEAARHDLADRRIRLRSDALELAARARRAERLIALIGQGVIPQARGALESARASYGVGRLPLLDVLSDLKVLLDARIALAAQEADRFQSLAALEPLLGRPLISGPEAPGEGDIHVDAP
jgi:outer membrane protein TolC